MKEKSIGVNVLFSCLRVFLSLVFPLITFPYASRILSPVGIGKVNFSNSIISYFVLVASLGIGTYATREVAKLRQDKEQLSKFCKEMFLFSFVCSCIAYLLFLVALAVVPKFQEYRSLLLVSSLSILLSMFNIEWLYTAFEEFKFLTIKTFAAQIISIVYLFCFVKNPQDILHYIFFGVLICICSNLFNLIHLHKFINLRQKMQYRMSRHFKPIIIFWGMTVVTSLYTMLDSIMLGFLSTDAEVGFYAASTKMGHLVLSMLTAISTVLLPRLSTYARDNDMESFTILTKKTVNILALLSLPMATGLWILARPIIILLSGDSYIPAVPSMQAIAPIVVIIPFANLLGVQILPALNKERISLYSYIFGAIVNVVLNVVLIPKFGAFGATIGSVCAEGCVAAIQLVAVWRFVLSKDLLISFVQGLVATAIMFVCVQYVAALPLPLVLSLISSFATGVVVYALTLVAFRNKYLFQIVAKFTGMIRG